MRYCSETFYKEKVTLWALVEDKLLPAMLILGRVFPLHEALDGHRLAAFIAEQHKQLQIKSLTGEASRDLLSDDSEDDSVSPENSSFSADAKLTDDAEGPSHRCPRCHRTRKEVSKVPRSYIIKCQNCTTCWQCIC